MIQGTESTNLRNKHDTDTTTCVNWLSRAHALVPFIILFDPTRPFPMRQNQAAGSMVEKQMGHCPHEVSTLQNTVTPKIQWK